MEEEDSLQVLKELQEVQEQEVPAVVVEAPLASVMMELMTVTMTLELEQALEGEEEEVPED